MGLLAQSVLLENLKERDQSQNLDIDGKLKLKRTLKQDRGVEWIHFAQSRNILASLTYMVVKLRVQLNGEKRDLLTN